MRSVSAVAAALLLAGSLSAQQPPAKTAGATDHSKMAGMDHGKTEQDHGKSPWKELDAYHKFMMDTWHPAKSKSDMAPTRAKIVDMAASAKVLAASKAPHGCDTPKLKDAANTLAKDTQGLADMVAKKADDAALKAALKDLHDKFEVLEGGCVATAHK